MATIEEHQQLLMLRGVISSLPNEQQLQVTTLAAQLRQLVESDREIGTIALALVGAEMAVKS